MTRPCPVRPRAALGRGRVLRAPARLILLFLALGATGAVARAQEAPSNDPQPTLRFGGELSVGWVMVPVVVRTPRGYVKNLERRDFHLTVDGRTVPVATFEKGDDAPVRLVFLQDLSGSMALEGHLDESRDAVRCLLAGAKAGDRFALATFANGEIYVDVPFTRDPAIVADAVSSWQAVGTTALYDAVFWLPEISVGPSNAKRAAVLVTDGVDNASRVDPATARSRVERAEIPVYVLGLATGSPYVLTPEGRKQYRYADVLNLLAHLTGGRYYSITDRSEAVAACRAIAEDLRFQYVLGFATSGTAADAEHEIDVSIDGAKKDWQISSRRGYRGGVPRPPQGEPNG